MSFFIPRRSLLLVPALIAGVCAPAFAEWEDAVLKRITNRSGRTLTLTRHWVGACAVGVSLVPEDPSEESKAAEIRRLVDPGGAAGATGEVDQFTIGPWRSARLHLVPADAELFQAVFRLTDGGVSPLAQFSVAPEGKDGLWLEVVASRPAENVHADGVTLTVEIARRHSIDGHPAAGALAVTETKAAGEAKAAAASPESRPARKLSDPGSPLRKVKPAAGKAPTAAKGDTGTGGSAKPWLPRLGKR